ncbi:M56 family metallopeptidase [Tissierella praeacuta]|uniref:M56 family metallopeptidase n=1 Tax=Tissierella praeacuta TaxID=43131 RepID=UPI0028A710D5|nr:M56 family metallopeptidase [Tissierella praeacuta]
MEILNMIFNMSIIGSIIFFIFILLKPITKKHFNSSWHYMMLILILAFFIIPAEHFIKLPNIDLIPNISKLEIEESTTPQKTNVNDIGNIKKEIPEYKVDNKTINEIKTEDQDISKIEFNIISYKDIIKYIWIMGVIVLLLLRVIPYIRFKSYILRNSKVVEEEDIINLFDLCKAELNLNTKIDLRICNNISSPMLIGIFNPIVLIPSIDIDYKKLKMIFLHELNHCKRRDIIIKVLGIIINAIHWFNPLIYILLNETDKYCEYSIDEKVVEEMDINDRKFYGETILDVIISSKFKRVSLTTSMGSGGKQLKTRLENMICSFKITRKKQVFSLFLAILVLTVGFTAACGILPREQDIDTSKIDELYKLRGTYIGDNSNVSNIINLLDFPEELTPNGMELFTKEEPFGLRINFQASNEIIAEYISTSLDYVWRPQSLILFSLIDNLEYIQYDINSDVAKITASYINREVADSLTMSTLGHMVSEVAGSKKLFREFYNIYGNEYNIKTNQPEGLVGHIVIEDNILHFREVEIVEWDDQERVRELNLSQSEFPNGYTIIHKDYEEITFELTDETIYTFTDVYHFFIADPKSNRLYTTTKKDEFLKHLEEYNLNDIPLLEQRLPYFIEVKDGKVISITEKFKYTI